MDVIEYLAFSAVFRDPHASLESILVVLPVLQGQKPVPFRVARRRFLRGVLLGVPATIALGGPGRAMASSLESRSLEFLNTHTGESLKAAYFSSGSYCEETLAGFDHLLRDHRNGEAARMAVSPAL